MKILHVIPTMNPKSGGPCQGIRNYEYGLDTNVVHRDVVCFDEQVDVNKWENISLTIHGLGKASTQWGYNQTFKEWLKKHVTEYDVVIINGLWLYHSYATINIISQLKHPPKVFIMPHGMLDPWFQKAKSRRIKALRNYLYWELIEKKVINQADGLLFTCQTELELAQGTFRKYHPKKEINIGYGIQSPPTWCQEMDEAFSEKYNRNKKYFLFLSRIHEKKGLVLLIEAYRQLIEKGFKNILPDLVIAGPGIESKYGQKILNIVDKYIDLSEKVHFVGMLLGNAKWGAIYGCEAFVLPSHQENFGIAVVEALACSKPVLISKEVNIWKEIIQENAGFASEVDDSSVTQMLCDFCRLTTEEKDKMSMQARLAFTKHFNILDIGQRLIDAIK